MIQSNRFIGGVLLVSGTAIGAGMLVIPVATSFAGFIPSFMLLFVIWLFFFGTAWLLLDVNLSLPGVSNFISMTEKKLGRWGKGFCWVVYLLLLYSLTAAYIAGSAPIFADAMQKVWPREVPTWAGVAPLLGIFGLFVYLGTRTVDWVNRALMIGLAVSYVILLSFLPQHVEGARLMLFDPGALWIGVPLVFTSYGFHIVIPTLTAYLHHNAKHLRWVLFIGSLIPFIVYTLWEFLVLGAVPMQELAVAWQDAESAIPPLTRSLQGHPIGSFAKLFSFFAILTSFLGVSMSLSDFLSDGLHMKKVSFGKEFSCLLTFIPPLLFVFFYPQGFTLALQYAGVLVALLLCLLPALMAWRLPAYRTLWRRIWLVSVMGISFAVIILGLCSS